MKTLFRAEHIAKTFITGAIEVHAIADMSFQIYAEELIVILGPSGSGKSTLLNIIGGIEPVSSGEAWYEDFALHAASPQELNLFRRKNIGFVFQFYNLLPHLTALENVELASVDKFPEITSCTSILVMSNFQVFSDLITLILKDFSVLCKSLTLSILAFRRFMASFVTSSSFILRIFSSFFTSFRRFCITSSKIGFKL